jgi:hypothetical protein
MGPNREKWRLAMPVVPAWKPTRPGGSLVGQFHKLIPVVHLGVNGEPLPAPCWRPIDGNTTPLRQALTYRTSRSERETLGLLTRFLATTFSASCHSFLGITRTAILIAPDKRRALEIIIVSPPTVPNIILLAQGVTTECRAGACQ